MSFFRVNEKEFQKSQKSFFIKSFILLLVINVLLLFLYIKGYFEVVYKSKIDDYGVLEIKNIEYHDDIKYIKFKKNNNIKIFELKEMKVFKTNINNLEEKTQNE